MKGTEQLFALIAKGTRVRNLDLREAELARAELSQASADELDLAAADMRLARMCGSHFRNCRFERVQFEKADWSGATLRMCVFDGAQGFSVRFDGARFEDCSAKGADFSGATLRSTKLTETSFERSLLREAIFDDAEGDGVQFRGADLSGASMIGARFDEADFRGANLQGADLSRGRFHSADFRGAILEGTRFDEADCTGARFDEGAGPHAGTASSGDRKDSTSFDKLASTALRQGLAALPGALAAREGKTAEFFDSIQREFESLADTTMGCQPIDLKAMIRALSEDPTSLRNALAAGGVPKTQMTENLERLVAAFDANPDQLPGEWTPWLEPLLKMTREGQALDLNVVFDALSALAESQKSTSGKATAPPTEEAGEHGG